MNHPQVSKRIPIRLLLLLVLLVATTTVAACTRERPEWQEPQDFSLPTPLPAARPLVPAIAQPDDTITDTVNGGTASNPDMAPATDLPVVPPATELTPPPPTPTPEPPTFVYEVQAGDTLASIARRYGVEIAVLIELNRISDPNNLKVGQRLRIPGAGPQNPGTSPGGVYVVQAGDTLFSIARQYGVSVDRLAAANNIADPSTLYVGQELRIPTATGGSTSGATRVHVVQPGETLSAIALQYGVSTEAIMQANDISDPNTIIAGTQLTIP